MGTSVSLNGVSYTVPAVEESAWGTSLSAYLVALSTGVLSKAGGSFTLTADADFGGTYGLKSSYYKSRATASTTGIVRLGNAESVGWRNAANSADKLLKVNSSNILEYDGNPIVTLALGSAYTVMQMNSGGTAYSWAAPTGTGAPVLATSPTLVTPVLGVASATSINSTTIPSSKTLVVTTDKLSVLAATSSSELAGVISDETGSGSLVFATSPTLVTPVLGVATATSINKVAVTAPATSATLTIADGGSIITSGGHSLTFTTTGSTNITLPTSGTLAANSNATADAAGIVTSFVPVIKSSVKSLGDADYTVLDADGYETILASTTLTANRTVTLPTAADNTGRVIKVKRTDTGAYSLLVDGEGAETIDGVATYYLFAQYDEITIYCNGTGWNIINIRQSIVFAADTSSTAATTSAPFKYTNETIDTARAHDTSTGIFTVPASGAGNYLVQGQAYSGGAFTIFIYKNGSSVYQGNNISSAAQASSVTAILPLAVGDTIQLRPDSSVTANGASAINRFSVVKIN